MIERIFDPIGLLVILIVGVAAFIIGAIVAASRGESWTQAIEVALLAAAGAFLARSFISILLNLGGDTPQAGLLVGWGFFLWPGAIDTVAALFGAQLLTTTPVLLWLAIGVGGFCGLMDGIHRIRSVDVGGVVSFVVDTSWGMGGTTNGDLIHLVNTFITSHESDGRVNAHRYKGGFRIKQNYAFTQGQVMSELADGPGTALYFHERTHISQNRAFGPLYPLSYIGWMAVMFVPGLVVGLLGKAGVGEAIEAWTYYNNPWETWGYKVQESHGDGPRTGFGPLVWSDTTVLVVAIVYFAAALLLAWLLISSVWL
jgi:hypothetical protein